MTVNELIAELSHLAQCDGDMEVRVNTATDLDGYDIAITEVKHFGQSNSVVICAPADNPEDR